MQAVAAQTRQLSFWAENAAPIGLVALVIVFSILSPTFLTLGNIRAMLVAAAILVILAIGQAFVITTGGIDLSISATMTLGAIGFGLAFSNGLGFWASALVAILSAMLIGLINGLLIAKGKVTDFIATLGTLSVATGLALIISNGKPINVNSPELLTLTSGSLGIFGYPIILAAIVAAVAWFVMFRTRFGLHVQAVGGSEESAAVVLGGVSLTGGKAKIVGPVIGALLLTALTNGLTLLGVSQFYQPLAVGLVVVLAALLTRFQKK